MHLFDVEYRRNDTT